MKVFVKKEFPLYKPCEGGFYTCEVDPEYNTLNLDAKCNIYFNETLDIFEYKNNQVKVSFFYEETDAYVPKTKYEEKLEEEIKLLEARIITLTDKVYELEINAHPAVMTLEEKYKDLHAIVHKLTEILEKPQHSELWKVQHKLADLGFPVKAIY